MNKFILLILCFTIVTKFGNNSFATSKKYSDNDKIYGGVLGCFDYLVKTRNCGKDDKQVAFERERRENALIRGFNNNNPVGRDMVTTAYIQRVEMYREKSSNEKRKGNAKNESFYISCLNEMYRIARLIGIK